MAQSGIHAFSGIILSKSFKYEKWFIPSLVFGSIIPDIDVIFAALGFIFGLNIEIAESIFHRTFTHSIFSLIIIYFLFLSISEITSQKKYRIIAKGFSIGMAAHIVLDIILWFKGVHVFWPLPVAPVNIWNYEVPDILVKILLSMEFILFRLYGWFLINKYIENPNSRGWFIKYLTKWIKLEFILFLLSLLFIYLNISNYKIFFTIIYIPSLIMALISTYILREVFNH